MSIALFAFVMSFGTAPRWIYFPAAALAGLRLWTGDAVPTRRGLDALQAFVHTKGFTTSVITALRAVGHEPA